MKNQISACKKAGPESLYVKAHWQRLLFQPIDPLLRLASSSDGRFDAQIANYRVKRAPIYCAISAAGWAFFTLFYFLVGATFSSGLCLVATTLHLSILAVVIRRPETYNRVANLHLAVSFIGLTLDSMTSGLETSTSIGFFCCVGLIAAHQSGWKTAFAWTTLNVLVLAFMYFGCDPNDWPKMREHSHLLDFVAGAGLFLLLTWMAVQSEQLASNAYRTSLAKSEELSFLAQRDQLTELANRYRFRAELIKAKSEFEQSGTTIGLVLFDLDKFKEVNDRLGHQAGDKALKEVARRLGSVLDKGHVGARLGGDEFAVLAQSVSTEELQEMGNTIVGIFEEPIEIDGEEIHMTVSTGLAMLPEDTKCIEELMGCADIAAYHAKTTTGSDVAVYDAHMIEKRTRRRRLVERLTKAVENKEFSLVYQPQVNVSTGQIIGVEALLRWKPVGGEETVSPAEFVPILESTGLINEVGRWVLKESCAQIRSWNSNGLSCVVSVNVSPIQFRSPNFVQSVLSVIAEANIQPSLLDLEITEGVMVDCPAKTESKLKELKRLGVTISVDDFGTGYSSLAYLKHLSLDRLKIDRVFIKDIPKHDDGSIASSIVGLADLLNLSVLAEGVETEEQLAFLKDICCDDYQGYLFSKPISADECTDLLLAHQQSGEFDLVTG